MMTLPALLSTVTMSKDTERSAKRAKPPSNSPASQKLNDNLASLNNGEQDTHSAESDDDGGGKQQLRRRLYNDDNKDSSSGESSSEEEEEIDLLKDLIEADKGLKDLVSRAVRCFTSKKKESYDIVSDEGDRLLEVKFVGFSEGKAYVELVETGDHLPVNPMKNILEFHSCCSGGFYMRQAGLWDDEDFDQCDTCESLFCLHSVGDSNVSCFCNTSSHGGSFFRLTCKRKATNQLIFQCDGCTRGRSILDVTPPSGLSVTKISGEQYMRYKGLVSEHYDDPDSSGGNPNDVSFDVDEIDDVPKSSKKNASAKKKRGGDSKKAYIENLYEEAAMNTDARNYENEHSDTGSDAGEEGGEESLSRTVPNTEDLMKTFSRKFAVDGKDLLKGDKLRIVFAVVIGILDGSNVVGDDCLRGFLDHAYWDEGKKALTSLAHYLKVKETKKKGTQAKKGGKAKPPKYTDHRNANIGDIAATVIKLGQMFHRQHCTKEECTACDGSLPEQTKETRVNKPPKNVIKNFIAMFEAVFEQARNSLAAEREKLEKKRRKESQQAKGRHVPQFCYQENMVSEQGWICFSIYLASPPTLVCLSSSLSAAHNLSGLHTRPYAGTLHQRCAQ